MMLKVSASPHIRAQDSTKSIMRDVFIALCPALLASFLVFGYRSIFLTAVTIFSCIGFEYLSRLVMKREQTIGDWSAAVTGILLAFNLPAGFPLWMAVLGSFFAIVLCKQCFGGLGSNFVNPALAARVLLTVSFPAEMTNFVVKESFLGSSIFSSYDLSSHATTLTLLKNGEALPSVWQQFIGFKAGTIGEISILALLIGAAYLLAKRVIDFSIPLSFIGSTLLFVTLCGQNPLYHLLSGGLILGAFFMATDYVTSPISLAGKIIFGLGCGLITGLIRIFGASAEGVSYSILLLNILTPHIDALSRRLPRFSGARLSLTGRKSNAEREAE